jgi:hypothetical protein
MESVTSQKSKNERVAILSILHNQVFSNDSVIQSLIQKIDETNDVYNIKDSLTPEEIEFFIRKLNVQKAMIQDIGTRHTDEFIHYETDLRIIEKILDQF